MGQKMRKIAILAGLILVCVALAVTAQEKGGMYGNASTTVTNFVMIKPVNGQIAVTGGNWYWAAGNPTATMHKYPFSLRTTAYRANSGGATLSTNLYIRVDSTCTNAGTATFQGYTLTASDVIIVANAASNWQISTLQGVDTVVTSAVNYVRLGLGYACSWTNDDSVYICKGNEIITQTLANQSREYAPAFAVGHYNMPL